MPTRYRLFALLAETQPDPAALEARLATLDPAALIVLAADVVDASADVRPKWEGPYVPERGVCFSEDSTEDLTGWIVAQGEPYWRGLVGAGDEALLAAAAERDRERADVAGGRWSGRTPHVGGLIFRAYRRSGAGDWFEALERELSTRG